MDNILLRDQLINLVRVGKDNDAILLLGTEFSRRPLISPNGDDNNLDFVINPVGFGELYARSEWERAVLWYDSVLKIITDYERTNKLILHKGLIFHNKGLPLIRLNRLDDAAKSIERAYLEDKKNFPEEAEKRPAYLVLCFLKPIVDRGHWNKELLSEVGTEFIFDVFEELYKTLRGDKFHLRSEKYISDNITHEELKKVLLRRYKIVKDAHVDPLMRVIYAGSILEGVLGNVLTQNADNAINAFTKISREDNRFLFYIELSNESFEKILEIKTKKKAIKRWDLLQMIAVAREIGLYAKERIAVFSILGNLLRDYRNLVHPSNLESIGKTQGSEVTFDVTENIANMITTILDVALAFIAGKGDLFKGMDEHLLVMDSGQHLPAAELITTPSGINYRPTLISMASPSRVKSEDLKEILDSTQTSTVTSTSSSSPTMGSTSTTTTLPNITQEKPSYEKKSR